MASGTVSCHRIYNVPPSAHSSSLGPSLAPGPLQPALPLQRNSERWRIGGERQRFLQAHSAIVARRNAAIFDFNAWPKMGGEMPRAPREQYE